MIQIPLESAYVYIDAKETTSCWMNCAEQKSTGYIFFMWGAEISFIVESE